MSKVESKTFVDKMVDSEPETTSIPLGQQEIEDSDESSGDAYVMKDEDMSSNLQ